MPKINFYRDNCIGCNSCEEHAPQHWELSLEDGKSVLKNAVLKNNVYVLEISEAELPENEKAAQDCPMKVIKIN